MIDLDRPYRWAQPDDAFLLAQLINYAGEGLPAYLWEGMAEPGENPWDVGQRRARREEGSFSYKNAIVVDFGGDVISSMIGYPLADEPEPLDYETIPAMFVPLLELENMAPGTWHVNVLATYPEHRSKGHGSALLALADRIAAKNGKQGLSIIVTDANRGARRLYEAHGYVEVDQRRMVKGDWKTDADNWVLMTKPI